jgi:hypothetical protein
MNSEFSGEDDGALSSCVQLLGTLANMRSELYSKRYAEWRVDKTGAESFFFEEARSGDPGRAAVALTYIMYETIDVTRILGTLLVAFNTYNNEHIRVTVATFIGESKFDALRNRINCYLAHIVMNRHYQDTIRIAAYASLLEGEEFFEFKDDSGRNSLESLLDYGKLSAILTTCEDLRES